MNLSQNVTILHYFNVDTRGRSRESDVSKPQVLGGDEARKEDVDALTHTKRHRHHAVPVANVTIYHCRNARAGASRAGHAVEDADEVRQVVDDGEVVLHDDDKVAGVEQRADDAAAEECEVVVAAVVVMMMMMMMMNKKKKEGNDENRENAGNLALRRCLTSK